MANDREDFFGLEGEAADRAIDFLMRLVGQRAFDKIDPMARGNPQFFDWYAREMRSRRSLAERIEGRRLATEFGTRNAERWARERLSVLALSGEPMRRSIPETMLADLFAGGEHRHSAASFSDDAVAAGPGRELWDQPCTELVELPADVSAGRHVVLRISGDSMTPFMHAGDSVLVRLGDPPVADSVIVARRPDEGYVVKQVGKLTRREVELLSLNPDYLPVRIPRDPRLVLGTVVARWCAH